MTTASMAKFWNVAAWRRWLLLAALVAGQGLTPAVQARETRFIVGVEAVAYLPHYEYRDGELTGFSRELLDAFAASRGYTFEYRAYPVDELFQQLISRGIDFKYPDNPYWQHRPKEGVRIAYSDPVVPFIDGVVVTASNAALTLRELTTLGTVQGFTPFNYEHRIASGQLVLKYSQSLAELIDWVRAGTVQGIYGNIDVIEHVAATAAADGEALVWHRGLPYTLSSYTLSTARRPQVIAEFSTFLAEKADWIAALKKKYAIDADENI